MVMNKGVPLDIQQMHEPTRVAYSTHESNNLGRDYRQRSVVCRSEEHCEHYLKGSS
jgi:hypothetical protein